MIEFLNANVFIYLTLDQTGYMKNARWHLKSMFQIGSNLVQELISRMARLLLGQKLDFFIYLIEVKSKSKFIREMSIKNNRNEPLKIFIFE